MQKNSSNIGVFVRPERVVQVTKFIARIDYANYGTKYVLMSKMSDRLKGLLC